LSNPSVVLYFLNKSLDLPIFVKPIITNINPEKLKGKGMWLNSGIRIKNKIDKQMNATKTTGGINKFFNQYDIGCE
jgi:hypothetical protein